MSPHTMMLLTLILPIFGLLSPPALYPPSGFYEQKELEIRAFVTYQAKIKVCKEPEMSSACDTNNISTWTDYNSTGELRPVISLNGTANMRVCVATTDDDGVELSPRSCSVYSFGAFYSLEDLGFKMTVVGCDVQNGVAICDGNEISINTMWNNPSFNLHYYIEPYYSHSRPAGRVDKSLSLTVPTVGDMFTQPITIPQPLFSFADILFKAHLSSLSADVSEEIELKLTIYPQFSVPTITQTGDDIVKVKFECLPYAICVYTTKLVDPDEEINQVMKRTMSDLLDTSGIATQNNAEVVLKPGVFIIAAKHLPTINTRSSDIALLKVANIQKAHIPDLFMCPESFVLGGDMSSCVKVMSSCVGIAGADLIENQTLFIGDIGKALVTPTNSLEILYKTDTTSPVFLKGSYPLALPIGNEIEFKLHETQNDIYSDSCSVNLGVNSIPKLPDLSVTGVAEQDPIYSRWRECYHVALKYISQKPKFVGSDSELCFDFAGQDPKQDTAVYVKIDKIDNDTCGGGSDILGNITLMEHCDLTYKTCGRKTDILGVVGGLFTKHEVVSGSQRTCVPLSGLKQSLYYIEYFVSNGVDVHASYFGNTLIYVETEITTPVELSSTSVSSYSRYLSMKNNKPANIVSVGEKEEEEEVGEREMVDVRGLELGPTFISLLGKVKHNMNLIDYIKQSIKDFTTTNDSFTNQLRTHGVYWENNIKFASLVLWGVVLVIIVLLVILIIYQAVRLISIAVFAKKLKKSERYIVKWSIFKKNLSKNEDKPKTN